MNSRFQWLHDNAAGFGVDSTRIALGGYSAGAIDSLVAATMMGTPAAALWINSGGVDNPNLPLISLSSPPTIFFQGTNDPLVDFSFAVNASNTLQALGVPVEFNLKTGEDHWYTIDSSFSPPDTVDERIASFMFLHMNLAAIPVDPPIADAGPDQNATTDALITLNGSGSSDPDSTPGTNDGIASYSWRLEGTEIATGEVAFVTLPLGVHVITLVVTDLSGLTAQASVAIDVRLPNIAPIAFAQSVSTLQGTEVQIALTGDDGEPVPSQALTFILSALPANGTLSSTSGGAALSGGLPRTLPGPILYYTPGAGFIGPDFFRFQVMDDGGTAGGGTDLSTEATVVIHVSEPLIPLISASTMTLFAVINEGETTPSQSFTIRNSGRGTLNYAMSVDVSWLSVDPPFGTSTGEADTITVNFAVSSLASGIYTGLITLRDNTATNSPQIIAVTLTVQEEAGGMPVTGTASSGGGGGCFIATATYGTPMSQEIDALRELRDAYLLNNAAGAAFVDAYYRFSPPIADFVARHPVAAATTRVLLTPIIALANTLWTLPTLFCLFVMAATRYVSRQRERSRIQVVG